MKLSFKSILKGSHGLALFMVIFVMAFFLLFVTGSFVFSQLELKKASNFKLATQAVETADAGLQHALAVIIAGFDFNGQLSCSLPPCTVVSQTSFPSGSVFSYTVTAQNDPADSGGATNDSNKTIVLNSTASGPNGTTKEVQAYIKRSLVSFVPPGAVYLPASSATINFDSSTSLFITGNDTAYDGSPAQNGKPAILGVATINDTVRDSFKSHLGSSRYNLAQGSGYSAGPPVSPSVITTSNGPHVAQIAVNVYNDPRTVKFLDGFQPPCPLNLSLPRPIPDPCILGTDSSPQITYLRESQANHIHIDDYVKGSGVLVIEGKAHLYGNFEFHGLVIHVPLGVTGGSNSVLIDLDEVLYGVSLFSMRNYAKIFGALFKGPWNQPQNFEMKNSAKIYYSSQGLSTVNTADWGFLVPQPPRVFAWLDK